MFAKPQKEHAWLESLVGNWTYEFNPSCEEGAPTSKLTGSEVVRSLGGLWVILEGKGTMPNGEPATTMMTLGFDPARNRFVGTWVGSMMTHMWVYEGTLDERAGVLTLDTEGPDMMKEGKTARYKEVIAVKSKDERSLSSSIVLPDGSSKQFMHVDYHRAR